MSVSRNGKIYDAQFIDRELAWIDEGETVVQDQWVEVIDEDCDYLREFWIQQNNDEAANKNIFYEIMFTFADGSYWNVGTAITDGMVSGKRYYWKPNQMFNIEPTDSDLQVFSTPGFNPVMMRLTHIFFRIKMTSAVGTNQNFQIRIWGGDVKKCKLLRVAIQT